MRIEFFFDFTCPFAYLAFTQIETLASRHGAELVWKPMLLGGVFRAVETSQNLATSQPAAKTWHSAVDMHRWARRFDVPLHMPTAHPMRSVRALRALLAVDARHWPASIGALYRAYWVEGLDIAASETVARALAEAGLSAQEVEEALRSNDDQAIREALATRTQEAIDRGVFGAPAMFVSGDDLDEPILLWGQDRLEMTEAILRGWRPGANAPVPPVQATRRGQRPSAPTPPIDFWYDVASPFAYLASTQIAAVAAQVGAAVRYRPILLGALFKEIGTSNVPMLAMSDAKRRYYARELSYWASYYQVPFRFASTFPLRTVNALRLVLQSGDRIAELSEMLFRAAWVDDQDIGDDRVLRSILEEGAFDAEAMLAGCADPAVKELLRDSTEQARTLGVFGVPTMTVSNASGTELFWGQDRLALMEWTLSQPD